MKRTIKNACKNGVMVALSSGHLEKRFNELYRPLCLYALNITDSYEDAEDVVQQLFTELCEKAARGTLEVENLRAYLYAAVRNRSLKLIQRSRVMQPVENVSEIAVEDDYEGEMERVEQEARLWDWIDELPKERRNIFLMAKQRGMKYKDIADELHISVKTVENQMGKALKSLRAKVVKIYLFFFG